MSAPSVDRPVLRVVRGTPTREELAAVVALVAARPAPAPEPSAPSEPSRWASRAAALRRPLSPGPGAWRASALPR